MLNRIVPLTHAAEYFPEAARDMPPDTGHDNWHAVPVYRKARIRAGMKKGAASDRGVQEGDRSRRPRWCAASA